MTKTNKLPNLAALLFVSMIAPSAYAADAPANTHIYQSFSSYDAPGIYLPDGADALINATLVCPTAKTPGVRIVLPAGSSTARFVAPDFSGPLFQPISLSLRQDYAQQPTRIMFRLHFNHVAVDGYLGLDIPAEVNFLGSDCSKPWLLTLEATRLPEIYKPGSLDGYGMSLLPFPDEQ